MRLLAEIFLAAAVLYFGWETPWSDRLPWLNGASSPSQERSAKAKPRAFNSTANADARSNRVAIDRPAYNKDRSFTGHIYYVDESGNKYWLDAQGRRHYEP